MHRINEILITIDEYLGGSSWFPVLLLGTGLFFTVYLKFPQLRFFKHAIKIVTGRYEKDSMKGDTTHFQALSTALSGTIGTGNIGGVGLAIFIGGPAALFWMWITAFLGMTTKFVECTLSHKYRIVGDDGHIAGGPMFYMERKLKMKWLAVTFAAGTLICAFGTGNMPQINNIASSLNSTFNIPMAVSGGLLAVILGFIIIGGIKRIAKVTEVLVPLMSVIYVAGALTVIIFNHENIIPAFMRIFADLFSGSAATGGFLGATVSFALTKGVGRGLYSNEAGQGSAAIAHSAAKADEPVSEGMVAILEPFIDTIIICSLTGMAILASGAWTEKFNHSFAVADTVIVAGNYNENNKDDAGELSAFLSHKDNSVKKFTGTATIKNGRLVSNDSAPLTIINSRSIGENIVFSSKKNLYNGVVNIKDGVITDRNINLKGKSLVHSAVLTTKAFTKSPFGENGAIIVAIGLLLFAFSTAISWSYYGDRAVTYLFGTKYILTYRILYVIAFFAATLIDTTVIWSLAAVAIILMTLPNLFGILMLHKDMKESIKEYWEYFNNHFPEEKISKATDKNHPE
ncbi:MAG: sodium:alanine symporter family protein [Deltaproteobacteria bacterium]|nr:sodium:alanine symporter family protein [Deltaproteobacteria bacterium]